MDKSNDQLIRLIATNGKNPATGYGKMELGLHRGLAQAGFSVKTKTGGGVNLFVGNPEWIERYKRYRSVMRPWSYCMNETTQVAKRWVDCLNANYERVIVPALPMVTTFEQSGVAIPVHYIPLGIDEPPVPLTRREPDARKTQPFRFLTYSLGDMRKGAELALMAFDRLWKRLGQTDRVELVVKCRDEPLWLTGVQHPQVEIVTGETGHDEWLNLLASCHAFVFASRGEGFGLPPREAVMSGLPTVATRWLGMWDVGRWGFPVEVRELWPAQFDDWENNANEQGSLWAQPETDYLDKWLWHIYRNYGDALKRARRGRRYLDQFSWEATGWKFKELAASTSV